MASQWHLLRGSERFGPYTFEQLVQFAQDGRLTADDLVWSQTLPGWTPASDLPDLPLPKNESAANHQAFLRQSHPQQRAFGGKAVLLALAGGLLLSVAAVVGLAGVFFLLGDSGSGVSPSFDKGVTVSDTKSETPATASHGEPSEEPELPKPWISAFVAEADEIEVGGSTSLRLDVSDPSEGARKWRVAWESSCGAAAPKSDNETRAVFLAPARPGWCRVKATLAEPSSWQTESTIDILVVPSPEGTL